MSKKLWQLGANDEVAQPSDVAAKQDALTAGLGIAISPPYKWDTTNFGTLYTRSIPANGQFVAAFTNVGCTATRSDVDGIGAGGGYFPVKNGSTEGMGSATLVGQTDDKVISTSAALSITAAGVSTPVTPDENGKADVSSLFSSDNTSLQQQIDNATGTGSGTSIQLETRKTKTLDWSTQTTASTACNISFAAGSGLRYCELLLTGVTAANIDIVIDTTTYTLKSADSTALTPETGDNLLIFAEYATNCFIVSRQLLSTVS